MSLIIFDESLKIKRYDEKTWKVGLRQKVSIFEITFYFWKIEKNDERESYSVLFCLKHCLLIFLMICSGWWDNKEKVRKRELG